MDRLLRSSANGPSRRRGAILPFQARRPGAAPVRAAGNGFRRAFGVLGRRAHIPPISSLTGAIPTLPLTCAICLEEYPEDELCVTPCDHRHCESCFQNNVRVALSSNPFKPARCCHVLPDDMVHSFGNLTEDEHRQYATRFEELTNPHSSLYCSNADCGKFIPNRNRHRPRIGVCEHCGQNTCKRCFDKSHFGPCDKAKLEAGRTAEDEINRLVESKGWKRCPNCLGVVQKDGGCDHMVCNCGQEFCYRCGQVYTTFHHACGQLPQHRRRPR